MTSPDLIHDTALLTVSAWQREALPTSDEAMLMLYLDQARRWAQQDNQSDQDWHRVNDVVAECMEAAHV
jgi:hypothetical protein